MRIQIVVVIVTQVVVTFVTVLYMATTAVFFWKVYQNKKLALISEYKTFIFKMDLRLCPIFSNLKTLLLSDYFCVALDLDVISCILKHSPVLEKLTLELFSKHEMEMKGSYGPEQRSNAISEHLKVVEVKCEVVDRRVLKVLKLCTFNIPLIESENASSQPRQMLSQAGDEYEFDGTKRRRLYLKEVAGLGPGPRQRGGGVVTAPHLRGRGRQAGAELLGELWPHPEEKQI
ncbi:hypothetical protein EJB05_28986, partial [Eragrostis curvula]